MNDSFPENGEVQTFQKVRMKPQGFYYPPDEDHGYGSLGSIIFESPELKKCEGVFALLTMNARDRENDSNDDTLKDIIRGVEQQVQGGMVEPSDLSEKAQKIFEHYYGDYDLVLDFAGRPMLKSAYGNPKATYYFSDEEADDWNLSEGEGDYLVGWDLHHMMPKGREGSDSEDNLIPVNINTNRIAGDKTSYSIDGTVYEVRRTRGHQKPYYAIYEKETGRFVIGFEPLKEDKKD